MGACKKEEKDALVINHKLCAAEKKNIMQKYWVRKWLLEVKISKVENHIKYHKNIFKIIFLMIYELVLVQSKSQ